MTPGAPLDPRTAPSFPIIAGKVVRDSQMRKNVRHATEVIQAKRARVVAERGDWEALREAGRALRAHALLHMDTYLEQFERNCTRAGGTVHWARDAEEARTIVTRLCRESIAAQQKGPGDVREVLKIKSMTTEEIHLNDALIRAGIHPYETDLAELIIQLGKDQPSHIVVPALHKNRQQIREIFRRETNLPDLGDAPGDLADAARRFFARSSFACKRPSAAQISL